MKGQTYVILGIIILIIVSVFAVTNVDAVSVNYLFWTVESPLILVILFSVLMGGLITATVGSMKIFHLQREIKTINIKNNQMEQLLSEHDLLANSDEGIEKQVEDETIS